MIPTKRRTMCARLAVLGTVCVLSVSGGSLPLRAQAPASPPTVSVTISPIHLFSPRLQLSGEWRWTPKVSFAATAGAGRVTEEGERYRIWEVGGQGRYFALGDFSNGLMLGVDAGYVDADGEPPSAMELLVGTRAGGFVGYKRIFGGGFTAEAQLGPVYVWGPGDTEEAQTLANLRVGWSF